MKSLNGNSAPRYLAEGEVPEGVAVITIGVIPGVPWREARARRNRLKIWPPEDAPEPVATPVRRFLCRDRVGAKIQEGADGPIVLEVAL